MEKFPDLDVGVLPRNAPSPMKLNGHAAANGTPNGNHQAPGRPWLPRADSNQARGVRWGAVANGYAHGHDRQKSISEAFRTIKTRHGSVSQNAHEIADALKAPVSPRLIVRFAPQSPLWPRPEATSRALQSC
jgi:solute carrier family 35 protein E1